MRSCRPQLIDGGGALLLLCAPAPRRRLRSRSRHDDGSLENLYGTTSQGCAHNNGAVELKPQGGHAVKSRNAAWSPQISLPRSRGYLLTFLEVLTTACNRCIHCCKFASELPAGRAERSVLSAAFVPTAGDEPSNFSSVRKRERLRHLSGCTRACIQGGESWALQGERARCLRANGRTIGLPAFSRLPAR